MKKLKNKPCDLSSCFLCRLSMKEWIPAIKEHKRTIHFKKGEKIFREGDPVTGIFFVYEGTVKVHKHWGKDKELIVRFAKKGTIVGHRGLGVDTVYPVSATAIVPVDMCFIDLDFFQSSLRVNHGLLYELMMFYAGELKESEKNMRNLAHMPVKGRLVNALIFLAGRFGLDDEGFINLELSRQNLASFIGTTYETLFRFLNELESEDMIRLSSNRILIPRLSRLENFMDENHSAA